MLPRRLALLAPICLAACGEDGPPRSFPPLRYDYLAPLQLNVASIEFAPLPPPGPLDTISPVPAGPALQQMAQDRLSVGGSSGRVVIKVDEARITRSGSSLDGAMAIRVDVMTTGGGASGFAEARVSRNRTGLGRDLRGALYDFTKQMLDDMNVELEFQLRQSLRDYLQTTSTAPAPAAVEQQDLGPPRQVP